MPRRQPLTLRPRAALAALLLILSCAACAQVHVDAYPVVDGSTERCEELLHDLPADVDGLPIQLVEDNVAGAWGDPPVILRCGVEPAAAELPCRDIAGEKWLEDTTADGILLTSVQRTARISVELPQGYSAAKVVSDLQPTIDKHDRLTAAECPR